MSSDRVYDIAVVGQALPGLSAAIYARFVGRCLGASEERYELQP